MLQIRSLIDRAANVSFVSTLVSCLSFLQSSGECETVNKFYSKWSESWQRVESCDLTSVYRLEIAIVPLLVQMEMTGLKVDIDELSRLEKLLFVSNTVI